MLLESSVRFRPWGFTVMINDEHNVLDPTTELIAHLPHPIHNLVFLSDLPCANLLQLIGEDAALKTTFETRDPKRATR